MAEKSLKIKVKKKKWVPVVGPALFAHCLLGEMPLVAPENALHRLLKVNAMAVLGDMKKQHVSLHFVVTSVKDEKAHTRLVGYELSPQFMKRLVRKRRDKVADSFLLRTADNYVVRAKPIIITHTRVSKAVQTKLRLAAREVLRELGKSYSYEKFVEELLQMKLQRFLKERLGKITALRSCELRFFSIVVADRLKAPAKVKASAPVPEEDAGEGKKAVKKEAVEKGTAEERAPADVSVEKKE
ncbi:hypothetical protein D6783_05515 [Candidatus Woesearchaeota archaeon]|nr:MAG: hypothetical protein D6783_05515 [Candidatus Woesearchaeota archaeon]